MVSIIVPVLNRRDVIMETLESVRTQTYTPMELLVVDDGSSDGTADGVAGWIEVHPGARGSLIRFEKNVGKCAAVNAGMERASGEYLMVLDSDDVLLPDTIAREVEFLREHPDCGMVFGRAFVLRDGRRTAETLGMFGGEKLIADVKSFHGDLLFNGNVVISSSALMRHALVRELGPLNVNLRHAHDWEYWIRMSRIAHIGFLEGPLIYYRVASAGALSANRLGLLREAVGLLKAERHAVDARVYFRALKKETKEALWLAYHDGNLGQCFAICWFALRVGFQEIRRSHRQ